MRQYESSTNTKLLKKLAKISASSNGIGGELVCDHLKKKVHWIYLFVSSKYTEKLLIHGRIFEMFGRIPNLQKMLIFGRIFG